MHRFAKILLFAVVAVAAIGFVGIESADASDYGYGGCYAAPHHYTSPEDAPPSPRGASNSSFF